MKGRFGKPRTSYGATLMLPEPKCGSRPDFPEYISDRFDQKHQELVDEGEGFEEDRDEYLAENIFFVPENARWNVIAAAAHTPEVGKVIDEAMRSIESENDKLKNILPKNFARQELDKRRFG